MWFEFRGQMQSIYKQAYCIFCSFYFSIALALWKKGCQWFEEKKKTKEKKI
jgi:hypothetical protein